MNLDLTKEILAKTAMYIVYGKQDEFLKDVNQEEDVKKFCVAGFVPQIISFEVKHEIDQKALLRLNESILSNKK